MLRSKMTDLKQICLRNARFVPIWIELEMAGPVTTSPTLPFIPSFTSLSKPKTLAYRTSTTGHTSPFYLTMPDTTTMAAPQSRSAVPAESTVDIFKHVSLMTSLSLTHVTCAVVVLIITMYLSHSIIIKEMKIPKLLDDTKNNNKHVNGKERGACQSEAPCNCKPGSFYPQFPR